MSVTVIPYNDPTSEIFGAWRTIEDIKNKAKQVAMDQALAQQHIQSAQTIDQMNQAKLQMDQQQASEYTSPTGIQNRQRLQEAVLAGKEADTTGQSLQNERMANENPLHLLQQQQSVRQARIAADSAQQNYNSMMEMMPDKKDLEKKIIQAEKYKLISQNLTDPHTADLMSKINAAQTQQTFDMLPKAAEYQQKQLDQALSDMGVKPILDRLKTFSGAAQSLGVQGAKAAVKGVPGFESFQDVPDDSMGQRGSEKDRELHMLIGLAKTGDKDAIEVLGQRIAKASGAKEAPPMPIDDKTGKPFMQYQVDPIVEASKRVAAKFATQAKLDAQGNYSIGEDTTPIQRRESVLQGTQKIPGAGTPTQTQPTTPTQSQTQIQTQSGTQQIAPLPGGLPPQSLQDSQKVLSDLDASLKDSSVGKMTYMANRDKQDVSSVVLRPYDKSYSLNQEGELYNWHEYDQAVKRGETTKTITGPSEGKPIHGTEGNPLSGRAANPTYPLAGSDIQQTVKNAMAGVDKDASVAQETRYRVAVSQLARAHQEGGQKGLNEMYNLLADRYRAYKSGDDKGISIKQWENLNAIVSKYGAQ